MRSTPLEQLLIHLILLFVIVGAWLTSFIVVIEVGRYLGFPVV